MGLVSSSLKALVTIALIVLGALIFVNRLHTTAWAKSMFTSMLQSSKVNSSDKEKEIERSTKARDIMKEEMRRPAPQTPKSRDEKFHNEVEAGERPISREQTRRVVLEALMSCSSQAPRATNE